MQIIISSGIKYVITLTVFLISLHALAQNNVIFNGGIADGFASKNYIQSNASLTGNNIYSGGIADGFAVNNYNQGNAGVTGNTIYLGGVADGFAFKNYLQSNAGLTGNTICLGGAADGFAFGSYGSFGNELPLPVELISFDASPINNKTVLCKWTTASEINNDYFTIERSKDGKTFETAGILPGAGYSTKVNNYVFSDEQPIQGISYYRLKQTDFDGKFQYSQIVAVTINANTSSTTVVYPNPITDYANIIPGSSFIGNECTFEVYNVQGEKVYGARLSEMESIRVNAFVFRRGELRAGIYFYTLGDLTGIAETGKLLLQ